MHREAAAARADEAAAAKAEAASLRAELAELRAELAGAEARLRVVESADGDRGPHARSSLGHGYPAAGAGAGAGGAEKETRLQQLASRAAKDAALARREKGLAPLFFFAFPMAHSFPISPSLLLVRS